MADWVDGPTGPKSKNLNRKDICQNPGTCVVRSNLAMSLEIGEWDGGEVQGLDQNGGVEIETNDDIAPDL